MNNLFICFRLCVWVVSTDVSTPTCATILLVSQLIHEFKFYVSNEQNKKYNK